MNSFKRIAIATVVLAGLLTANVVFIVKDNEAAEQRAADTLAAEALERDRQVIEAKNAEFASKVLAEIAAAEKREELAAEHARLVDAAREGAEQALENDRMTRGASR